MIRQCWGLFAVCFILGCGQTKTNEPKSSNPTVIEKTPEPLQIPEAVNSVLKSKACLGCHRLDKKLIGPSYLDIAQKVTSRDEIVKHIRSPEPSRWPNYPPMVGIAVTDEEGGLLADWILSLKKN